MLRRGSKNDAPAAAPADERPARGVDPFDGGGLDTLAAILRAIPESGLLPQGMERDEAVARFEAWALHALVLGPVPGREEIDPLPAHRDWPAMRQFGVQYLRESASGLSRTIDSLQDVVWTVIEGVSRAVQDDAVADDRATAALERLRSAASSGAADSLKEAALTTITELAELIAQRATRQQALASELGERVGTLQEQLAEAQREADVDGLTRLANRAAIDRELKRATELRTLMREPVCLLLVDLDHFKRVNDTYGHPAGDEVLRRFSDTLSLVFPRKHDLVGRYGGEEFAVLLRNADASDGERLAARLVETTRGLRVECGAHVIEVTTSVGVAEALPLEGPEAWVARADAALYAAKGGGRDRF
ncbi:MAG: GGDEF domain-containing protein, partial [Thermoleophilia bacterium]